MSSVRGGLLLLFLCSVVFGAGCGHPKPGQRWVDDFDLKGTKELDDDDVLEGLATQETNWWPCAEKKWYDAGTLDQDIQRIETYYAAHGFFQARVKSRQVKLDPDGKSLDIILQVVEGKSTKVQDVTVEGLPSQLGAAEQKQVKTSLGVTRGERFDYGAYSLAKELVRGRLRARGYAYARVEGGVEVDRQKRVAYITIRATPGPLVRFGETHIQGNGDFPQEKLRLLVAWKKGEPFSEEKLKKTRSQLSNLRVFSAVRIELPKSPTEVAPVTIKVWPTKLKELRLGVGVGLESRRHEVRFIGRFTWRNFLGGLRTLAVKVQPKYVFIPAFWDYEEDGHGAAVEAEVKLTQPMILGTRISVFGLLGYELDIQDGFRFHGPLAKLGGARGFFEEKLWVGASWSLQFLDFFSYDQQTVTEGATKLGMGFVDPYSLAYLEQYVQLDLRNSVTDPRLGFWAEVRLEEGFTYIGSEFTYIKLSPEVRGYIPLGTRRLVLALRGLAGYILPISSPDVASGGGTFSPITRRLFLGGPNSHRGFSYSRLSPQVKVVKYSTVTATTGSTLVLEEDVFPVGGDFSLLLSADLRLRVYKLWGNWIGLTAFFDAGDVVSQVDELAMDQLHLAVGGSLQYQTPIGNVRFAVGVRLNRLDDVSDRLSGSNLNTEFYERQNPDPGEQVAFHLTLGQAF